MIFMEKEIKTGTFYYTDKDGSILTDGTILV